MKIRKQLKILAAALLEANEKGMHRTFSNDPEEPAYTEHDGLDLAPETVKNLQSIIDSD